MTDESKTRPEKIENLELNKETVQELTEQEGEQVAGGYNIQTAGCTREVLCYLK